MFARRLLFACACLCLCGAGGTTPSQQVENSDVADLTATARKTLKTYDKAVIAISAIVKIEAKSRGFEREFKTQCVATIIDQDGMAVTSLANLDPRGGRGSVLQSQEIEFQIQEVKYRLTDGTEVLARVVLKDEDLDLAFLVPQKPLDGEARGKIASVSLGEAAPTVEILDPVILFTRAGDDLNYIPIMELGRIIALLSQPRTCYVSNQGVPGVPMFNQHGKLLGIMCRCIEPGSDSNSGFSRLATARAVAGRLILPTADIARLVPQAKEEAKKAAEIERRERERKEKRATERKKALKEKAEKGKGQEKKGIEKKAGKAEK